MRKLKSDRAGNSHYLGIRGLPSSAKFPYSYTLQYKSNLELKGLDLSMLTFVSSTLLYDII
jgi:hypothetical protein